MVEAASIGKAVCTALGLEANKVMRITLNIDPTDIVTADVQYVPNVEELKEAEQVFATYKFKVER